MRIAPWMAALVVLQSASTAFADDRDALKGKFTFDWHNNQAKTKCEKVGDQLMAEFKSDRYRCDMKPISNTATGATARACTKVAGGKEFLIFDTRDACANELKAQSEAE